MSTRIDKKIDLLDFMLGAPEIAAKVFNKHFAIAQIKKQPFYG